MISQLIKQYEEVRKVSTEQVMVIQLVVYWILVTSKKTPQKTPRLIAADLSKQKALDGDSRAIQQVIFTVKIKAAIANTRVKIHYILEQSKETILQFSKVTTKVLLLHINSWIQYSNDRINRRKIKEAKKCRQK